ncbi:SIMPL domain-containing protein [Candidatus Roizmanbacteria bacterium]|nr:SIMPL domain-containing protein [Candidatus Roizmanbacteria bacterium]
MNIKNLIVFIGMLAAVLVFLVIIDKYQIRYPLSVVNSTQAADLSVVGEGKVDVIPDTGSVTAGISIRNESTATEAQAKMNVTNNAIIEAMKQIGIDKKDIRTTNYSVYPNYTYDQGNSQKIQGYGANANVTIKVKNVAQVSQVIEAATKAGANEIQGTQFTVNDPAKYREAARENAIKNAREQAAKLASSLGIKLGRVTNIVESNGAVPVAFATDMKTNAMVTGGGNSPSIEPGSQTITSVVTLYFEKK